MADRTKLADGRLAATGLAAERLSAERISVSVVEAGLKLPQSRIAFRALDGTVLVVLEADNEADARAICAEHGFEFIALCEG